AELDLAFFGVDGEDKGFDDFADAQNFLRVVDSLFGRDLADVDEAFNALFDLNEGTEVGEAHDRAGDLRANGETRGDFAPRIGEGLLEAEGEAALFWLDGEDDGVNCVADL